MWNLTYCLKIKDGFAHESEKMAQHVRNWTLKEYRSEAVSLDTLHCFGQNGGNGLE